MTIFNKIVKTTIYVALLSLALTILATLILLSIIFPIETFLFFFGITITIPALANTALLDNICHIASYAETRIALFWRFFTF